MIREPETFDKLFKIPSQVKVVAHLPGANQYLHSNKYDSYIATAQNP